LALLLLEACAHPLEGKIWSSREARFVAEPELAQALARSSYRLLGETHDNAAHHELRARLIRQMARERRRMAVVFEQFDLGVDAELARAQAAGADAEALADAGKLDRKGWRWPLHKPLVEAAIESRLPVRGGNLPREEARAVARGTREADLGAAPWNDAREQGMRRVLSEGHCAPVPEPLLTGMVRAQRARDASLAYALLAAGPKAILIAGNGHVRRDHGVPIHLGDGALSVGFVEVRDGATEPAAYEAALYDYVWFTAAAARGDPCAAAR
jgi:uncharacterized iron-regulated protein